MKDRRNLNAIAKWKSQSETAICHVIPTEKTKLEPIKHQWCMLEGKNKQRTGDVWCPYSVCDIMMIDTWYYSDSVSTQLCQLFVTPWTAACQAPWSMGFSEQDSGVGCHFFLHTVLFLSFFNYPKLNKPFYQRNTILYDTL